MIIPKHILEQIRCWTDIEGYEGKYQVSRLGEVRSLNYHRQGKVQILKQSLNTSKYKLIVLSKECKTKSYSVHRLVAQAFLPNPNNYPEVNHKDENLCNNYVWNLEWCTRKYNANYGTLKERLSQSKKGEKNPMYGKSKKSK